MNLLSHKILKIILALCLAVPLLAWSGVIFPYTAPKAFIFRILVEVAAVLYFYLVLKYPGSFFFTFPYFSRKEKCHPSPANAGEGSKDSSPRQGGAQNDKKGSCHSFVSLRTGSERREGSFSFIKIFVLVFLIISFLSAIFGVDFYKSFWGDLERGIGVWGLLHFVAWFLMLGAVFQIKKEWLNLLKISVGVSSLVALSAIIQKFTSLGLLIPQTERVFGTIGNAGFLGTYLIFNIFFAGYLAINSFQPAFAGDSSVAMLPQNDKKRLSHPDPAVAGEGSLAYTRLKFIVYCALFIVNCFALLLTGTRGAILGLAVGVIVFLVLLTIKSFYSTGVILRPKAEESFKKWPIISLAAIFILAGLLFYFHDANFIRGNSVLSRVVSISLSDATAQNRLLLWGGAWQAWQDRPILGWGPENFEIAANKYFDPRLNPHEAFYDRAHNFIFDYGVATGWLGFFAYLAIFLIIFFFILSTLKKFFAFRKTINPCNSAILISIAELHEKNIRKNIRGDFYFFAVTGSLLTAYLVQNFFIFDSFISCLMLFFTLALASNCNKKSNCHSERSPVKAGRSEESKGSYKKIILFIFAILIILFLYLFNFKPFLAARWANQILSLPPEEYEQINPLLEKTLALKTYASSEIVYQIALDYLEKINQAPQLTRNEEFYRLASGDLKKSISRSPQQSKNYIALAWLDLYFSGAEQDRLNEAIVLGQKVKELSPNKKDAYLILTAGYSLGGQKEKAMQVVEEARKIDKGMGEEVKDYWEKIK